MIVSSGKWFEWGKSIIGYMNKKDTVLEVGFGTGILQEELLNQSYNISGIDESSQMIKLCKKRNLNNLANLKIVRGFVNSMPYPNHHFDKVISTFPSEYIYDYAFINEVDRILKPDGKFIALTSVRFTGTSIKDSIYRVLFKISNQQLNSVIKEKIFDNLSKKRKIFYKFEAKNYEGVELCYIIISKK